MLKFNVVPSAPPLDIVPSAPPYDPNIELHGIIISRINKKALHGHIKEPAVQYSNEDLRNAMLQLLCTGCIEEDAIYIEINSNMIKDSKLFGFECHIPKNKHLVGQAVIRCYGPELQKYNNNRIGLEFNIGFFFGKDDYRDCLSKDINYETACNICDTMINLGGIYNALCIPLYQPYR